MSVEEPFGFRKSPPHAFGELAGFEDIITPRARSTRKASAQASEGMSAFIRQEKEANLEDSEKSSDTDSQASEYDEVEYIWTGRRKWCQMLDLEWKMEWELGFLMAWPTLYISFPIGSSWKHEWCGSQLIGIGNEWHT